MKKKICLVCSYGGHLTQILNLMNAFKDNEVFFITYNSERAKALKYRKYLLENIGLSPVRMFSSFFKFLKIFMKENPKVIISTGSEIAIPAFLLAKILGIKTIFIESVSRIRNLSGTGKFVYPIADLFFVQWEQLAKQYKKARYAGGLI